MLEMGQSADKGKQTIAQQTTERFPLSQIDNANALTRLADQIFFAIEAAKKVYN
jgi:hypothetical protein